MYVADWSTSDSLELAHIAVTIFIGIVSGLIAWIVRPVDRRLDELEGKADDNGKDIARLDERTKHLRSRVDGCDN